MRAKQMCNVEKFPKYCKLTIWKNVKYLILHRRYVIKNVSFPTFEANKLINQFFNAVTCVSTK